MVAINFYCLHFVDHALLESGVVNINIPYITVLIIAPVTFIVSTVAYFRNNSLSVCFECHAHFGRSNERGFLGKIFSREGRFQLRMLMLASLLSQSMPGHIISGVTPMSTTIRPIYSFIYGFL